MKKIASIPNDKRTFVNMTSSIDYTKYQTVEAIPKASSMIETFRAVGYSIEAAIADIIDKLFTKEENTLFGRKLNFQRLTFFCVCR